MEVFILSQEFFISLIILIIKIKRVIKFLFGQWDIEDPF